MSNKTKTEPQKPKNSAAAETQRERWVKYGSNVTLTILVMVAVSVLLVYLAQTLSSRIHGRVDLSKGHRHSLSAPTVDLIRNLPGKVKLVSLYTKSKRDDDSAKADSDNSAAVRYREVADLLEEYQRKGRDISVEIIDPYAEPGKVTQLFDEVTKQYGNNVNLYRDRLADFSKTVDEISRLVEAESKAIAAVPTSTNRDAKDQMQALRNTIDEFPESLKELQSTLPEELKKANPDYKRAAKRARTRLRELSRTIQSLTDQFEQLPKLLEPALSVLRQKAAAPAPASQPTSQPADPTDDPKYAASMLESINLLLAYGKESTPRYAQIKKLSDDLSGRLVNLGELKQLDELRQKKSDSIIVMGPNDMVVIPNDRIWLPPAKGMRGTSDGKEKLRFAGEQQISTALVVLTSPERPRVAFIRNAADQNSFLPQTISFRGRAGQYFDIAEKLRGYNFEVVEKDLSGRWEQQLAAAKAQDPTLDFPPDATDEQLKHAVWVVHPGMRQSEQEMMRGAPPSPIGPRLAEHLASGGSAMVLFNAGGDDLAATLQPWGVTALTDSVALHEKAPEVEGRASDQVDAFCRAQQFFFEFNQYGDHPLAAGLQNLDIVMGFIAPVTTSRVDGVTATPLVPLLDGSLQVYAKKIPQSEEPSFVYDPNTDMKPPLFAGAVLEKIRTASNASGVAEKNPGGNRLVVVGSDFPTNQWTAVQEKDVQHGGSAAARLPGNTELFTNCVFWLSKMEKMMNIAPANRDVVLIASIGPTALTFWHVMILLFVPCVVLAVGGRIYLLRRD